MFAFGDENGIDIAIKITLVAKLISEMKLVFNLLSGMKLSDLKHFLRLVRGANHLTLELALEDVAFSD